MDKLMTISNNIERTFAYIDESGDASLEIESKGVSSHFIISAVVINENELELTQEKFEQIRKKFVGEGELKSSKLKKNPKRRIDLLEELSTLNYKTFTIVVDKSKLMKDSGYRFRKSFYKNLNDKLHKELRLAFSSLTMISDKLGRDDFQLSFRKYVEQRNNITFFDDHDFSFSDSRDKSLIQLADIIAGTISYNYEESKKKLDQYKLFKDYIDAKAITIITFPVEYDDYIHEYKRMNGGKHDELIYANSIRLALNFISKYENSEEDNERECLVVIKYLLNELLYNSKSRYVTSIELRRNLSKYFNRDYKPHYFKSKIIAKLRDSDVLIASSSKGYKIPESEEELIVFVNHTNSMIQPMLGRISKARRRVFGATNGELDILSADEYVNLRKLLDKQFPS